MTKEILKSSVSASVLWTALPSGSYYAFAPYVFVFGNRNTLFSNYLEMILTTRDDNLREMISDVLSLPTSSDRTFWEQTHYEFVVDTDKEGFFKPHNQLGKLQLLAERKPFEDQNCLLPVIYGYPNFPEFRLSTMSECIINFPDQTIILPITKSQGQ